MLIILDKDGTLVQPKSGNTFVQSPDDQELLPGVAERIAELKANGATIVVASNQAGIAGKHKTLEATIDEMRYLMKLLPDIEYCLFCPHLGFGENCWQVNRDGSQRLWQDECLIDRPNHGACGPPIPRSAGCRKPRGGMLLIAMTIARTLDAIMIGDRPEDEQAAIAANVPFQWADEWRMAKV